MTNRKMISNRVECTLCHETIESKHVHDFVRCKCENCFVDGGLEYQRFGWSRVPPIDRSEYEEKP